MEVSVKVTAWPVVGALGVKVNADEGFEGVVDWKDEPLPHPAIASPTSTRNRDGRIFILIFLCLSAIQCNEGGA